MASGYLRAALATAAAAALLTTSTGGYTAWQAAHAEAAPDSLRIDAGPTEVLLGSPGTDPHPVDTTAGVRAVVGETITVRVPVTVHLGGQSQAVLTVDVPGAGGDKALVAELAANPTPIRVTPVDGGPDLTPAAGDGRSLALTGASDGRTYLVEWSTSTRPPRDGRPATKVNVWGAGPGSLQGLAVGTRPMTISLTPGSTTPAAAPAAPTTATGTPAPATDVPSKERP